MCKSVELSGTVYEWLKRHDFMSEEVIIGVILNAPESERRYTSDDHFEIDFYRNNKRHTLKIMLWVHERDIKYMVYKAHCKSKR